LNLVYNNVTKNTIKISFDSLKIVASLNLAYYTSGWNPLFQQTKSCFLNSCCSYGTYGNCAAWLSNSNSDKNPCGFFTGGILNYPGVTGCLSGSGCAACNCFSCANSCNYYRWSVQPGGVVWGLYQVAQLNYVGSYTISHDFPGLSPTYLNSYSVTSNVPYLPGPLFDVAIDGLFNNVQYSFGTKMIAISGSSVKIVDASLPNSPQVNEIGDIQSNSVASLQSPNNGVIEFNTNLATVSLSCNGAGASFVQNGLSRLQSFQSLPTTYNGLNWVYNASNSEMFAMTNSQSSTLISINFNIPVSVAVEIDQICPMTVSVLSVLGCHSCAGGVNVSVIAYSSCLPGFCSVSSNDGSVIIQTFKVYLNSVPVPISIMFNTNEPELNSVFFINCNGGNANFTVNAVLSSWSNIYGNSNNTYFFPSNNGNSNFVVDANSIFGGIGLPGTSAILGVIGFILAILTLLLILFTVFRIIKCWRPEMTAKSYIKTTVGIDAMNATIRGKPKDIEEKVSLSGSDLESNK